jgi:hypothetical protein
MSFADWARRSKKYQDTARRHGIAWTDVQELAQAAYKAGERQGRKDAEDLCVRAMELRERMFALEAK